MAEEEVITEEESTGFGDETIEEEQEEVSTEEESTEEKPVADQELAETVKKLQSQLEESNKKVTSLEESLAKPPEAPKKEGFATPNIDLLKSSVLPTARNRYSSDKKEQEQFDLAMQSADAIIGAVMTDRVGPVVNSLYEKTVTLAVENEYLRVKMENSDFTDYEKAIRETIDKMPTADKDKKDVVYNAYLRAKGSAPVKSKEEDTEFTEGASVRDQIKEVSGGAGKGSKASGGKTVRLTPEQEKDRTSMADEGFELTPEMYQAQLVARQKIAKEKKTPIPQTLSSY